MTAPTSPPTLEAVIAAHLYGEFLGALGRVWTTCTCGERIDATFCDGLSVNEVFKANWSAHLADAIRVWLAGQREAVTEALIPYMPQPTRHTDREARQQLIEHRDHAVFAVLRVLTGADL